MLAPLKYSSSLSFTKNPLTFAKYFEFSVCHRSKRLKSVISIGISACLLPTTLRSNFLKLVLRDALQQGVNLCIHSCDDDFKKAWGHLLFVLRYRSFKLFVVRCCLIGICRLAGSFATAAFKLSPTGMWHLLAGAWLRCASIHALETLVCTHAPLAHAARIRLTDCVQHSTQYLRVVGHKLGLRIVLTSKGYKWYRLTNSFAAHCGFLRILLINCGDSPTEWAWFLFQCKHSKVFNNKTMNNLQPMGSPLPPITLLYHLIRNILL